MILLKVTKVLGKTAMLAGLVGALARAEAKPQAFSRFGSCEGKATENSRVIKMKVSVFVDLKAMFSGDDTFDSALVVSTQPEGANRREESILLSGATAKMTEADSKKTMEIKHVVRESGGELSTTLLIDLKSSTGELRITEGREERAVTLKCDLPR